MKLLLVRHGQTDWNKMGLIQGRIDNPLNETGITQINQKAPYFKKYTPTHLYSTSLIRAKLTLQTLSEFHNWNHPIEVFDAFIERDFGALEGQDISAFYQTTDFTTIDGFEMDHQIINRVKLGLNILLEQHKNDDVVVIVAHAHTLKSMLIHLDPSYDFSYKLNNCAVLDIDFNKTNLESINIIN